MEINQFQQFMAIAEYGTMREAAERLFVSQPTLSYNLKKLESELGCKLFTRVHNQLRLTPYGEIVLKHTETMTRQMTDMLEELAARKRLEEGTVRIGSFSLMFSTFEMVQIAAELPDIRFEVHNVDTNELVEGLLAGRFDMIILPGPVNKSNVVSERLYDEQAYVSLPAQSPYAGQTCITPDVMSKLEYQIEDGLAGYGDWFREILECAGVSDESVRIVAVEDHLRTKDIEPRANLITSFIMEYVRVSEARVVLPVDMPQAARSICMAWTKEGFGRAKHVIEHVHANKERLISGNAFFSQLMFPNSADNLHVSND